MTKSDLAEILCAKAGLPKKRAQDVVNTIFESMLDAMARGERIEIRGFGSFKVKHYEAYTGRNPKTGAPISVKPKVMPAFKAGRELKFRVNETEDGRSAAEC